MKDLEPVVGDPFIHKRATGRTTRMLRQAALAAAQGQRVVIVAHDDNHIISLIDHTLSDSDIPKFEEVNRARKYLGYAPGGIQFVSDKADQFDWPSYRCLWLPLDTTYTLDHYTIEQRYRRILVEWTRYDLRDPGKRHLRR